MNIVNIALILLTVIVIIWLARKTKVAKTDNPVPVAPAQFKALTLSDVEDTFVDGELICRAGFLHYDFSCVLPVDEGQEGLFVGYAKADSQHDARICVYDDTQELRGYVNGQTELYQQLLNERKSSVYGFVRKVGDDKFVGEVCIRVR
ncbi:hypothetical protein [Prevotella corporis]|uniref:Uncharacterized protein n=1 Tax=Prevotella corporis TaxID=28128 RepID=A0A133QQH3_9BACT|nr:hypothetical protein [Prevotella corporis]KXA45100.1 hypothetical protein HMPREF3226_00067 [Prevotella corporis]